MKSTTFALGALMASVAIAQPHKQNHARHHKRASPDTTVIVTDWVTDYETVGVTTTIWVSPGYVASEATSTSPSTTSTSESASSSSQSQAQFYQPASSSTSTTPTQTPTPSTSSTSSSSVYIAPTTSAAPSVYVAPVESSSSSTSSYVAPVVVPTTTAPAAVYSAPAETTTSAAPAATTSTTSSSGSSGGVCASGSPCTGDITYYEAGLGACGLTTDGSTDKVVALPVGLMGSLSNDNPYCGKTITISYGGKTTEATVVDKCMGCMGDSIDLSNAAFLELAELAIGRTQAEWWFN